MASSQRKLPFQLKSPLVLLLVAAVLAGGVAWTAQYYLEQREQAIKAELAEKGERQVTPRVAVVVPRVDVKAGTILDDDIFVARPVENDLVYPDTVLVEEFEKLRGKRLAQPLLRGRPLRMTDVVAPEVRDVSTILPNGRRALTIEIDSLNSIAQTLRPNHRVDVFLIGNPPGGQGAGADAGEQAQQATLYMQNMLILATGTKFHNLAQDEAADRMVQPGDLPGRQNGYDTVTLLVTPAEAARLLLGQKMGTYRVALRGTADNDKVRMAALRGSDVLPPLQRGRDAGVEYIVGGRGDKLVSELPVPPSQMLKAALPPAHPAMPSEDPAAGRMTISLPMTGAERTSRPQDN